MKPLWLSLILCLFLVSSDDCSNPMFAVPVVFPTKSRVYLNLLPTPQNQTAFGFCHEMDGRPSCCGDDFVSVVEGELSQYDYQLSTWSTTVLSFPSQTLVNIVTEGLGWTLNSVQMPLAIKIADTYKLIVNPSVRAAGGLLGYFQGMLCFACHPEWSSFLGGFNYSVLNITQATCEGVWSDVMDYTNVMQAALIETTYLLAEIMKADANAANFTMYIQMMETAHAIFLESSWCTLFGEGGKNCHDYVCQDVLSGAYYPYDFLPALGGINVGPMAHFNVLSERYQERSRQGFVTAAADDDDGPQKPNYTYIVQNEYPPTGGFAAFELGCANPVSTYACPPPLSTGGGTSFDWKLFLSVALPVLVLFFALIAIFLFRRKHTVESVPLDDDVRYHHLRDGSSGGSRGSAAEDLSTPSTTVPRESPGAIQ